MLTLLTPIEMPSLNLQNPLINHEESKFATKKNFLFESFTFLYVYHSNVRLFVSLGLYTKMTTLGCLTIIKNKK
jgi:hypothetical protein